MTDHVPNSCRVLYLRGPESVEVRRVRTPRPRSGELLVRVDRATTCGTDLKVYLRGGHPTMLQAPCPFGHEVAGTVIACGHRVDRWREGDRVVVANSAPCGKCPPCAAGRENLCEDLHYLNGAFAEILLVPKRFAERSTYRRPEGLAPEVAALAEPLACVLHGLATCGRPEGREVIVLGAGPIGLLFVIEAAHRGFRVVATDLVEERVAAAKCLGADSCILLREGEGHAEVLRRASTAGGSGAELVIEATGVTSAWQAAIDTVAPGGTVVLFGGCPPGTTVELDTHRVHYSEITVRGVYHHRPATFARALERLAESPGRFSALITGEYPLEGVVDALNAMQDRRILKAAIDPWA